MIMFVCSELLYLWCEKFSFLCSAILLVLLYYVYKLFLKWNQVLKTVNGLPCMKLKSYQFLGHAPVMYPHRCRTIGNDGLSPHVYDFQALNGYNHLFSRDGISITWMITHLLLSVFKAESAEVILNSSTEIQKSWIYDGFKPWLGTGLFLSNDAKWRSRRKLLTPALHFNMMKEFLPIMNKQSWILSGILDTFTKQEFVNICPVMTRCSFDIICESVLGKESHTQIQEFDSYLEMTGQLKSMVFEIIHNPLYWNGLLFKLSPLGRRYRRAVQKVHNFTNLLISEKKKIKLKAKWEDKPKVEDSVSGLHLRRLALVDLLLEEHLLHNSLSENDIREEVETFAFAGHDTTSVTMMWILYMVGLHPWVQEKIHEELDSIFNMEDREVTMKDLREMKYLECVIKETMRLYPSVPLISRVLINDVHFGEHTFPKGSVWVLDSYLLHRDPEMFPDPERFNPERFSPENCVGRHPFAYVPFSAGPRNCIGQRFALMEIKTVLSSILRKYKFRSLDARDKIPLLAEITLMPGNELRIQVRKRYQKFDFHSVYYFP